ncbi:phosphoglycolate phosphatase [Burkholderia cepacia]|uniref:phosphoglycolate phosphatase n=1 Tax=Burkholderia cepacia TaxID=292 RepID=UPI001CF4AC01|nr:phosphoglycolate phosphatase [Burkholderia cepacia]MCA8348448.1 phosphoglycolate phosphatase [Burkholderia cepacia]
MKTRLITFDLDGTLFDTGPEISVAVNRTLAEYGYPPVSIDTVIGYIGHGKRELMRQVLVSLGIDAEIALDVVMPVFDTHYDATVGMSAQPYPGVPNALVRLRSANICMAVVTNKERRFAIRLLEKAGFESHFDVVLGGDSLPHKKPHPLPIHYCLERLTVPVHAAAHLGDSRTDVQSARRAGVAAWAVPYGYNHGEPISDAQPDRIFATIEEMADYVASTH